MLRNLVSLGRARLLPFVWILPLLGFGWGHWDRALPLRGANNIALVLLSWTFLQLGTMWLNASLDRDEGEVLFGRAAEPPEYLPKLAYATLLVAVVVGYPVVGWGVVLCASLSVCYSHPRLAWKGHSVLGPLVNILGYGLLSAYAGWLAVGVSFNLRTGMAALCVVLVVTGVYFGAQTFQEAEDSARGYRTFVVRRGPRATVRLARACVGAAILLGLLLSVVGWLPRLCLLLSPLALHLDAYFRAWERTAPEADARWAHGLSWRLLLMGFVAVGGASVQYVVNSYSNLPVAGLGTAAGHPYDRPRLSPQEMRIWESQHEVF